MPWISVYVALNKESSPCSKEVMFLLTLSVDGLTGIYMDACDLLSHGPVRDKSCESCLFLWNDRGSHKSR